MTAADRTAAFADAAGGEPAGDPDPDPEPARSTGTAGLDPADPADLAVGCPQDVRHPVPASGPFPGAGCVPVDQAELIELSPADLDLDVSLDRATAARLRDEARRSRPRIVSRLADAGHLPAPGAGAGAGTADGGRIESVDEYRNLSCRLDENAALFERIDDLHDRRTQSTSPRERQVASRALAEALHRVVAGYQVDLQAPHRPVLAARRVDEWLGRVYAAVAAGGPHRQGLQRWWMRAGSWVRLGLALLACVFLAENQLVAGAAAVAVRSLVSVALYAPPPPVSSRRRLLGYDPNWTSCVFTHVGDAAILTGMGLGLHLGGHTTWGVVTVFVALVGLTSTMLRVASGQHGFRLPRLFIARVGKTVVLPLATTAAAVVAPDGHGVVGGIPVAAVAVVVVAVLGVVEIVRTIYFALARRRLFRRAATAGGHVPDAIVAHTADGIVVNLQRAAARPHVFDLEDRDRRLQVVGGTSPGSAPRAGGVRVVEGRPARPGRVGRRRR